MADDTYPRGYRHDPPGRGGAGAPRQATDPLTELARLIGQSDPFAADSGRDRGPDRRATDPRSQASDWRNDTPQGDPQYGNASPYDDYQAAAAGPASPTDPHHDQGYGDSRHYDGQQIHQDPSYYRDPHEMEVHTGSVQGDERHYGAAYFDDADRALGQDADYYDEAPTPRRRGGVITAAALLGLAVIGTAGAFAYRAVFTSAGPPSIIAREAGPNKIVPATQSADNSGSKQIYDRAGDRGQNERIVPREEQPLNLADPARAPQRIAGQNAAAAIPAMPGGGPARSGVPSDTSALASAVPTSGGEPRKIRTVTIKADQSPGDSAAPHPAAPPRTVASQAVAPPAASRSATAVPTPPSGPLSLSPQSGPSAAPSPPARAAAIAPPPVAAGNDIPAGYFVQVSAQKTQEEAEASFRGIQAKYASVLSGRQPVFRRKDLGSKGVFYGAQVGPFSREDAVQLCESLKSAGASCMIQRN